MSELEQPNAVEEPASPAPSGEPLTTRTARGIRDFVDQIASSSPARLAVIVFVIVDLGFAALLWLPLSANPGQETRFVDAVFTATSAVTVTGLTTVSTAAQWSVFGQVVILIAIQVGGLGTLTMTSILALSRQFELQVKMMRSAEDNDAALAKVLQFS